MNHGATTAGHEYHLARIANAVGRGQLTPSAARNIGKWLTEPWYAEYRRELVRLLDEEDFSQLDDLFWRTLPFGTAGRRGRMATVGCNAVNSRTIGETVAALASYLKSRNASRSASSETSVTRPSQFRDSQQVAMSCAIAYDCRHQSRAFAELSARIMVAAGFHVYFLDGSRSTPALAFTVRTKECQCGIMISASHNPPEDNAIKVFWNHGGQITDPHDEAVTRRIEQVREFSLVPWDAAIQAGSVEFCQQVIDGAFRDCVVGYSADRQSGPRGLRILYSPLHGVGRTSVVPVLEADGFLEVAVFAEHALLDPDFSNVPDRIANPEHPAVFDRLIAAAADSDLILASDPDADRIGAAARRRFDEDDWRVFNGNQLAVLLAEFLLRKRKERAELTPDHFLVSTRVTTPMLTCIARHYDVRIFNDCLTGFKWIAPVIDREGPRLFVLGCEEAHGYLVGDYIRDKDAAGAAMILTEFAAEAKRNRRTLWDELDQLYLTHGYHREQSFALPLLGAHGVRHMNSIMGKLREADENAIPGYKLLQLRDFRDGLHRMPGCAPQPLDGPRTDLLFMQWQPESVRSRDEGTVTCAVRPSGTEAKLKFYLFAAERPVTAAELPASQLKLKSLLADFQSNCSARCRRWLQDQRE